MMPDGSPLEIVEIIRPASQGRTQPFLCRAEDEQLYYVKGNLAGPKGQFCEWIVAHLAVAFGLPIPPFRVVHVSPELLEETPAAKHALGSGFAFGSLARTQAQWFEVGFISEVPRDLRCAVLAFDWWVQNSDRIFDNPNLLWAPSSKELVVIDHAYAFDDEFWPTVFLEYHIFRDDWETITNDPERQADYQARMETAMRHWEAVCDSAPLAWKERQAGALGEELLDCSAALKLLNRGKEDSLWEVK